MSIFTAVASIAGGPGGAIGSFFVSGVGKLIGILSLVSLIVGSLTAIYFSWEGAIKSAEDAKYEIARKDALIQNRDHEIVTLKNLSSLQEETLRKQTEDMAAINLQNDSVAAWVQSQAGTATDRESSAVLKETFDRLYGKLK